MNTTLTSDPIPLPDIYALAIQAVYTATPTGTFKLQASCDPIKDNLIPSATNGATKPTNWTDIGDSSASISAAGNYMWNLTSIGYSWIRIVYTDASSGASSAHATVRINMKGY